MNRRERRAALQREAAQIFRDAEGKPERLAMLAAQWKQAAHTAVGGRGRTLEVQGIVSARDGAPYVHLTWGAEQGQLDPGQARSHALLVLEAAQNAITDAAIMEWARTDLDLDVDRASLMIDALRTYRADRWGQPDLELEFDRPAPEGDEP